MAKSWDPDPSTNGTSNPQIHMLSIFSDIPESIKNLSNTFTNWLQFSAGVTGSRHTDRFVSWVVAKPFWGRNLMLELELELEALVL
ncbi:hypothetical protein Pyn_07024 [Prunus yedoensis var. nudiflora]|uniref:Uncharacterized protein n=1 Tax=Prunus yedoensis var. nudiflora TaxID=2094558 RepID=A0A314UKX9_PRUYE|nr:hypothetical protein Pyn_07024 [Prunus yedoensis var. nudiflora]